MSTAQSFALGSYSIAGAKPFGTMVRHGQAVALTGLEEDLPPDLFAVIKNWEMSLPKLRRAAARWEEFQAVSVPVESLKVHLPYRPRQIFAVAANYRRHVIELIMADPDMRSGAMLDATNEEDRRLAVEAMMNERADNAVPYIFSKLPTSVAGPCDPLVVPRGSEKLDWECELGVVIGRPTRNVSVEEAGHSIAGYAVVNDVTARDLVFRRDVRSMGTDWLSAKSQPGFAPFGPWLVPAEFVHPYKLGIRLDVNGSIMQDESTADMLIPIHRQIEYLSSRVQLLPGDLICTGSPAGNGSYHDVFLKPGDLITGSISGLGEQRIECVRCKA